MIADAMEIFQSNAAPRVLGRRHQRFGNAMVFAHGQALPFLEQVLGRFCAFVPQALTKAIDRTVRIRGDVDQAERQNICR